MKPLAAALTVSASQKPRVRMGEAIRLRLEGWMRRAADEHAVKLAKTLGHKVSVAGAIRDLVSVAVRGNGADAAYASGYTQGFLAGYSDGKQKAVGSRSALDMGGEPGGRLQPQPTRGNEDYQSGGEGEP